MSTGLSHKEHATVLLDVDGTLCDNTPRLLEYTETEYGVSLTRADITEWSYHIDAIDRHIGELIDEALTTKPEWFLLGMDPIDGAKDAAGWFQAQGHTVKIATHRPATTHDVTEQWLSEHGIPYDEIIQDVPRNKGLLDGDLLVDDYHLNVQNAIEEGMAGGLFKQPYSDPTACDGAVVADRWDEMLSRL